MRWGFPGYFLIVHDIVEFVNASTSSPPDEGSAANSAVCFRPRHHRCRRGRARVCSSNASCRRAGTGQFNIDLDGSTHRQPRGGHPACVRHGRADGGPPRSRT